MFLTGFFITNGEEIMSIVAICLSIAFQQVLNATLIVYSTNKASADAFGLCNSFKVAIYVGMKEYMPYLWTNNPGFDISSLYYTFAVI